MSSWRDATHAADEAKKAAFRRGLDEQIRVKREMEARLTEPAGGRVVEASGTACEYYDPWGRAGSGAPLRDADGNVVADVRGSDIRVANMPQNIAHLPTETTASASEDARGAGGDAMASTSTAVNEGPPPTQAWEHVVVDKMFQKGADGESGIARYLQRYVRYSDDTPRGAILNSDFRRVVAELNVAVNDASYDAVAASCAFDARKHADHWASAEGRVEASRLGSNGVGTPKLLSVRALAVRLANLAAAGDGISAIHAPVQPSPLTGSSIARVPLDTHFRARRSLRVANDGTSDHGATDPPAAPYHAPRGPPTVQTAWGEDDAVEVANVGVPPMPLDPHEHEPPPQLSLRRAEQVEEAVRAALIARTKGGRDVVGRAMRILTGAHTAGGRAGRDETLDLAQFRAALKRLNINPADPKVVEEVFRRHDADGNGTLDHGEFVRYLLPQDFAPTSPREYRQNYRGYTPKVGEMVQAGFLDSCQGAGAAKSRDGGIDLSAVYHGGVVEPAGKSVPRPGFGPRRGVQRPEMVQQSQLQGRDARMHGMLPDDSARPGVSTAGGHRLNLYKTSEAGGEHDLSVRRIEAAVLSKLQSAKGGDATHHDAYRIFRYFDTDREGFITVSNLRLALQRLNVDPTDAAFGAFVAKYDPAHTGSIAYGPLSEALVPRSSTLDGKAASQAAMGGTGQRWGADGSGKDTWAGYDRSRIAGTLENLNQPSFFDETPPEAAFVPRVANVEEVERLLIDKVLERGSNQRGPRDVWKYFDRDGSGSVDRAEFENALSHFNISASPEIIDAFIRKYDRDGDGNMDYMEMLACLLPESTAGRMENMDTVNYIKRLDIGDPAHTHHTGSQGPTRARTDGHTLGIEQARVSVHDEGRQHMSVKQFQAHLLDWMCARGNGLAQLRKLFKFLDADNSGQVSHEEFARGIMRMNIQPRAEDLRRIVAHYDANGDGYIDFNEFITNVLPEHMHPGYEANNWQAIAHHDPKPPNIMPVSHMLYTTQLENLIAAKVAEKSDGQGSARGIFRELDWDHSGTVSPDEFRRWLTRLNFFPDEETFSRLWRSYDPQGKGFIAYRDFVDRVTPKMGSRTSVL